MLCHQDDVCLGAINKKELKRQTGIVLSWLRNAGMILNEKKSIHNSDKILFLWYSISKKGVSPDQVLIGKILKVLVHTNKKRVLLRISKFNRWCVLYYTDLIEPFAKLRKMLNLCGLKNNEKLLIS